MATERAFNQVKSILGKLDRSIDEARAKRLGDPEPAIGAAAPQASQIPQNTAPVAPAAPAAIGPGTLIGKSEREPSPFGRARPIPFKG